MLKPVQPLGNRPPLFIIHGTYGTSRFAERLAATLDSDQPIYGIDARGFDGSAPPYESVDQMATDYVAEICRERPGPYLIASSCRGCVAAIEVARKLVAMNQTVGVTLLIDPPPFHSDATARRIELGIVDPGAARQMEQQTRKYLFDATQRNSDRPFSTRSEADLRHAAATAKACYLALVKHRAEPFYMPTDLIISSAAAPGYFNRLQSWQAILPNQRCVHVLRGEHDQLLHTQAHEIYRLVNYYLENAVDGVDGDALSDPARISGDDDVERT